MFRENGFTPEQEVQQKSIQDIVREGFTSVTGLRFYSNAQPKERDENVMRWFEGASMEQMASLYDATFEEVRQHFPSTSAHDLFKAVSDVVPAKLPLSTRLSVQQAMQQNNRNEAVVKAFLLVNTRTILAAVNRAAVTTRQDPEVLIQESVGFLWEKSPSFPLRHTIAARINSELTKHLVGVQQRREVPSGLLQRDDEDLDVIAEQAEKRFMREDIDTALDTLSARERRVLQLRFGFDAEGMTLEETGRQFRLTRESIRRIEAKALRKMRQPHRSKGLQWFVVVPGEREDRKQASLFYHPRGGHRVDEHIGFGSYFEEGSLLQASGLQTISDFFSASPEEIFEGWTGRKEEFKDIVERVIAAVQKEAFGQGVRGKKPDLILLTQLSDAVLHRAREALFAQMTELEKQLIRARETCRFSPTSLIAPMSPTEREVRKQLVTAGVKDLRDFLEGAFPMEET